MDEKPMDGKAETKAKAARADRHSGITGGLILILLGVLFLLVTHQYLAWSDWWAYFVMGLGAILILDFVIRSASGAERGAHRGKLVGGAVLIVVGAAHIFGMSTWWPLILIGVGLVLLVSSIRKPSV
jgi:hypothetical protein